MIGILIGAVPTGGAANRSSVLRSGIGLPRAIGEAVICVRGRADIRAAGSAITSDAVLGGAVLSILRCERVASVFVIGSTISVGAGVGAPVLRRGVIRPAPVSVRAVRCSGAEIRTA